MLPTMPVGYKRFLDTVMCDLSYISLTGVLDPQAVTNE